MPEGARYEALLTAPLRRYWGERFAVGTMTRGVQHVKQFKHELLIVQELLTVRFSFSEQNKTLLKTLNTTT